MARTDSWFRFYNTTLDNPKAQRLSGDLFKGWINLLCLASKRDGVLPSVSDIAFSLRMDETEIETLLETLHARGLLDLEGDDYTPHDWDELQFKSDKSTDRVAKYRERQKKKTVSGNVTGNVSVTAQEQSRTEQIRTEQKDPPKAPKGASYPYDFESFWTLYPNKVGKDAAFNAWKKRKKSGDLPSQEVLVEAIGQYINAKPADRAYCNPSTWLNQGRWQDALSPTASPAVTTNPTKALTDDEWRSALRRFQSDEKWPAVGYGPRPGYGGCQVPPSILQEFQPMRKSA